MDNNFPNATPELTLAWPFATKREPGVAVGDGLPAVIVLRPCVRRNECLKFVVIVSLFFEDSDDCLAMHTKFTDQNMGFRQASPLCTALDWSFKVNDQLYACMNGCAPNAIIGRAGPLSVLIYIIQLFVRLVPLKPKRWVYKHIYIYIYMYKYM